VVRTLDLAGAAALVLIGLGALTYLAVGALAAYASWRRIRRTEDLYDRAARSLGEDEERRES
jgi:hypothetical protein